MIRWKIAPALKSTKRWYTIASRQNGKKVATVLLYNRPDNFFRDPSKELKCIGENARRREIYIAYKLKETSFDSLFLLLALVVAVNTMFHKWQCCEDWAWRFHGWSDKSLARTTCTCTGCPDVMVRWKGE